MVRIVVVDNQAVQQNTTFVHHQEQSPPSLQWKRSDHCNCGQQWEYGSATDCPGERAPWSIIAGDAHARMTIAIRRRRIGAKGLM
jgi:hypothetical protein